MQLGLGDRVWEHWSPAPPEWQHLLRAWQGLAPLLPTQGLGMLPWAGVRAWDPGGVHPASRRSVWAHPASRRSAWAHPAWLPDGLPNPWMPSLHRWMSSMGTIP